MQISKHSMKFDSMHSKISTWKLEKCFGAVNELRVLRHSLILFSTLVISRCVLHCVCHRCRIGDWGGSINEHSSSSDYYGVNNSWMYSVHVRDFHERRKGRNVHCGVHGFITTSSVVMFNRRGHGMKGVEVGPRSRFKAWLPF